VLKRLAILLSVIVLGIALVACGEDGDETPTPQPDLAETIDYQTSDGLTLSGHL
jgi:hypothetical protein